MEFDDKKVSYVLRVEQDWIPVKGNAIASGDETFDREVETDINRRLDDGDVWAWANVTVEARYEGIPDIVGTDNLGCCSYRDEPDFCQEGGYYDDMKDISRIALYSQLEAIYHKLTAAIEV